MLYIYMMYTLYLTVLYILYILYCIYIYTYNRQTLQDINILPIVNPLPTGKLIRGISSGNRPGTPR